MSAREPCVVKYKGVEVLVLQDTMTSFRAGKLTASQVLASEAIFTDASKRALASERVLVETFGTASSDAVIAQILAKGEYRLSTKERRVMTDQMRLQVIQFIHVNYVNPDNGLPYSTALIDAALSDVKFVVDLHVPVDRQVEKYLRQLNDCLRLVVARGSEVAVKKAIVADASGGGAGRKGGKGGKGSRPYGGGGSGGASTTGSGGAGGDRKPRRK